MNREGEWDGRGQYALQAGETVDKCVERIEEQVDGRHIATFTLLKC